MSYESTLWRRSAFYWFRLRHKSHLHRAQARFAIDRAHRLASATDELGSSPEVGVEGG